MSAEHGSGGSGERFIVQRPIVYSGNAEDGFFESSEVHSLLEGVEDVATTMPSVPHITLAGAVFARRVMSEQPDTSLLKILSDCRKAVDTMPNRQSGFVKSARLLGSKQQPYVVLNPRNALKKAIRGESEAIHKHFDIPFDPRQFFPHVSLIRVADPERAAQLRDRLNDVISGHDSPMRVALGTLTVVRGARD